MSINTNTNTTEKVWLITGCSTGFGKELALAALKRGDKVIATARTPAKLSALVEAGAHPLQLDVTRPLAELQSLADQAVAVYGRIDVLVNNAAYVLQGVIEAARYPIAVSCVSCHSTQLTPCTAPTTLNTTHD
jgi:NAD(P)-dependent dehydrogenase (short-subunit alcohol dehydrogenase family)